MSLKDSQGDIQGSRGVTRHSLLPLSIAPLLTALVLTGCVNGARFRKVTDRAYLNASNITLSQVVRTRTNPSTQVDLSGNGTGALAKPCTSTQNAFGQTTTNTSDGPSNCRCAFRFYRTQDASEEPTTIESDTVYREPDLIRCTLPSELQYLNLATVQVSVRYGTGAATDKFSNEVPFNLTANSGYAIDPTIESSYAQVYRYQCTAVVTYKPNYWGDVYDRDLSEDPRATTPMNFYTTNIGKSVAITASGYKSGTSGSARRQPLAGWDCPANPLDPRIQYSSTPADNTALLDVTYAANLNGMTGPAGTFEPDFKNSTQPLLTKYDMRIFSDKMRDQLPTARDNADMLYPPVTDALKKANTFYVAKSATGAFRIPVNAIVAPGINTDPTGEKGPLPIGYAALSKYTADGELCPSVEDAPIPSGYKFAKLWLFRSSLVQRAIMGFNAANVASGQHFNGKELACVGGGTNGFAYTIPAVCNSASCRFELSATKSSNPATQTATAGVYSNNASTWPMELGLEERATSAATTQVFDYLYITTPTTISREQILARATEARPYIPYRYISSLDCRNGSSDAARTCIGGRTISNYVLSEDIGYAFSSTDQALDQPAVDAGAISKFPLCVLVKE